MKAGDDEPPPKGVVNMGSTHHERHQSHHHGNNHNSRHHSTGAAAAAAAPTSPPPALQVICLGGGGGPSEDNVTGFLVRSLASEWARGSLLAVDAGSHLAPIIRILERDFPVVSGRNGETNGMSRRRIDGRGDDGPEGVKEEEEEGLSPTASSPGGTTTDEEPTKPEPTTLSHGAFAGLRFPNASARANALHVIRNYVSTYLITHPHLDHLSGFVINTAAFHATSRPKTLAALPSTVEAVKQHIFNDIIWPNLTDEEGGVGFVTFQRLKEGGDPMVGSGEGRGYIDVSDRLGVKAFKVSHGTCTKSPPSHQHRGSLHPLSEAAPPHPDLLSASGQHPDPFQPMTRQPSQFSAPGTPSLAARQSYFSSSSTHPSPRMSAVGGNAAGGLNSSSSSGCVVDSSAFFIREEETQREVLMFGDVEPDAISFTPRTYLVWQEAARKVASGSLRGIFIECSYDDSQADAFLFGHLSPRHLIAELQNLGGMVLEARVAAAAATAANASAGKKRKRSVANGAGIGAGDGAPVRHMSMTAEQMQYHHHQQLHLQLQQQQDRKRSRGSPVTNRSFSKDLRRSSLSEYQLAEDDEPASPHSNSVAPVGGGAAAAAAAAAAAVTNHNSTNQPPNSEHVDFAASRNHHPNQHEAVSPRTTTTPAPSQSQSQPYAKPRISSTSSTTASLALAIPTPPPSPPPPLAGLRVVVIHVKDTLSDGPPAEETILAQLKEHERRLCDEGIGLGCEFVVARSGESYWF